MKNWISAKSVKLWELDDNKISEMESWIKLYIGKRYTQSAGYFHFRTKKDCAFFLLRWA